MTKRLVTAALALFVAFSSFGIAGCGDSGGGGENIASACAHACDCLIFTGNITEGMRASCEAECRAQAEADMPPRDCIDCVAVAPCGDPTYCQDDCPTP